MVLGGLRWVHVGVVDGLEAEERLCCLMNALCSPPPPLPSQAVPDTSPVSADSTSEVAGPQPHTLAPSAARAMVGV